MADGLCGPSNALQNFQKHSTVDRTLQQDRLLARQSPSQGFRSSPGPNAGLLDPEFEAFQAGYLPLEPHGFQPQGLSHAPQNLQHGGLSAWANDFQRMNIANPRPPQFQQQQFSQNSQQRQDPGGWHNDFAQQNYVAQQPLSQLSGQGASSYGFSPLSSMPMAPQYMGGFTGPQVEQSSMGQQKLQPAEAFDDEAFAKAFADAASSEVEVGQESEQLNDGVQRTALDESLGHVMIDSETLEVQERLGADLIDDLWQAQINNDPEQRQAQQNDPDALARTAAQLLDSVRDNQSDKFQKSQFLGLMRQLRDREVTVEGNRIVGINAEETEELKIEIIAVCTLLKKIANDNYVDRDIGGLPRMLLKMLLRLDQLYRKANAEVVRSTSIQEALSAIVDHPAIQTFPAIHRQAKFALFDLNAIADGVPPQYNDEMAQIKSANLEVSSIIAAINEPLPRISLVHDWIDGALNYPSDGLSGAEFLLGYNLDYAPNNRLHAVHAERMRDILGADVAEVMDLSSDRGLFCPELHADRFFDLVGARASHRVQSPEFKRLLREIENEIEDVRQRELRYGGSTGGRANLKPRQEPLVEVPAPATQGVPRQEPLVEVPARTRLDELKAQLAELERVNRQSLMKARQEQR